MRRSLAVLSAAALGISGLAATWTAPASAAPADQANTRAAEAVPDELLVGYVRGASSADRERARGRASAQRVEQVVAAGSDRTEVELVRVPSGANREQAIADLQSDPTVDYAEPNWVYRHQATVTDPYFTNGSLWGMYGDLSAPANPFGSQAAEAWAGPNGVTGSASVYVGVIDEGIQFDHPDLDGQVWANPYDAIDGVDNDGNGYVDDIHGWDFDGNNNTIYDGGTKGNTDDHGTHVSGTIGAKANNGVGVVGVNHSVTLISGKFLGRRGGSLANAVKAVDYFTDLKSRHGLNIVATNNSWGGGGFSQALLDAIVRGAKADILFVAAAGNSGSDNDSTASYPSNYDTTRTTSSDGAATYDAVIAVAAIDSTGALASFSQYGEKTVDLGAPGVGVWSTTAYNGYSSYNGTSMATPHVSGAAALLASVHTTETAAQIKQRLLATAVMTSSLCGKTATGGRLDVAAAIAGTPQTQACATAPTDPGTSTGKVQVTKGAKSGAFTSVTASWRDFAGTQVLVSRTGATWTKADPGSMTETWRGSGTVTYTVCETNNTGCVSASVVI